METKHCKRCDTVKSTSDFYGDANKQDGLRTVCKECDKARQREHLRKLRRERGVKPQVMYATEEERVAAKRAYRKKWRDLNKGKVNATTAKRRAAKIQADFINSTFEKEYIDDMYANAKEASEIMGVPFHVDHIVPLQGEDVCGLHCLNNLQILPAAMNQSKSNKHEEEAHDDGLSVI